ncbi:MAG: M48 family metalloprotease [Acidiphilium sp.]|nr:M48 family metalloprotease [Acidiphilium sp.]
MDRLHREFNSILDEASRSAGPAGVAIRPRLLVVPSIGSFFLKMNGGACAMGNLVLVGRDFWRTPDTVRKFVLAHEVAHAIRGHTMRLLGYWFVIFSGLVAVHFLAPPEISRGAVALIFGLAIALSELARPATWELEADRLAADITSPGDSQNTLRAVFRWSGVPLGERENTRIAALGAPIGASVS